MNTNLFAKLVLLSQPPVIPIIACRPIPNEHSRRGYTMPILMMALLALAVFGVIGGLLLAAEIAEHKKAAREAHSHLPEPVKR
jgi:hypothetical protein